MQRSIEAPAKEWSTDAEAAAWLNIPERTLVRLANQNKVPGPKRWNKREQRWGWRTLVFISGMLEYGFLDMEDSAEEEAVKRKP